MSKFEARDDRDVQVLEDHVFTYEVDRYDIGLTHVWNIKVPDIHARKGHIIQPSTIAASLSGRQHNCCLDINICPSKDEALRLARVLCDMRATFRRTVKWCPSVDLD